MKIFKICALSAAVLAQQNNNSSPTSITLTGEESVEQLDAIESSLSEEAPGPEERRGDGVDPNTRRRKQLKISMLWMLSERKFGKYLDYGCHCFPSAAEKLITSSSGIGEPMDDVDSTCSSLSKCYRCLEAEYEGTKKGCDANGRNYGVRLTTDELGNKNIECTDPAEECKRNICECDKAFAYSMRDSESSWDVSTQKKKGFNRENECSPQGNRRLGIRTFGEFIGCCGDKSTFPFNQPRHAGQCCDGYNSKPEGTC